MGGGEGGEEGGRCLIASFESRGQPGTSAMVGAVANNQGRDRSAPV